MSFFVLKSVLSGKMQSSTFLFLVRSDLFFLSTAFHASILPNKLSTVFFFRGYQNFTCILSKVWVELKECVSNFVDFRSYSSVGNSKDGDVDKPFACPVPGCKKRYKNVNGIKYHARNGHRKESK